MTNTTATTHSDHLFPQTFFWLVLIISLTPFALLLFGVDFSSTVEAFDIQEIISWKISDAQLHDEMSYALAGSLKHGLLEWSSVMVAFLTIIIAFSRFAIKKDITIPILGVALFFSGAMDAFHTLAATRLIDAVADNSNLIPFTWALSRGFNACILIIGAIICLKSNAIFAQAKLTRIITVSVIFAAIAYFLIHYMANKANLPQTQFPDAWLKRPFDAIPLMLFIIAIPIFWRLYKKEPNLLTASLVIALMPEIILESHVAFGSAALFDSHFNIAHGLKILAYLVPFIGLVLDYIRTYQLQLNISHQLKEKGF